MATRQRFSPRTAAVLCFSQGFCRGLGARFRFPAAVRPRRYESPSAGSRKTLLLCDGRSQKLFGSALVRGCSADGKVFVAERSKPLDPPKNAVAATVAPYLELMRFSRPTGR